MVDTSWAPTWFPLSEEHAIVPLGTVIEPWGTIGAVGTLHGERYYWLTRSKDSVTMMPASEVERRAAEGKTDGRPA